MPEQIIQIIDGGLHRLQIQMNKILIRKCRLRRKTEIGDTHCLKFEKRWVSRNRQCKVTLLHFLFCD
jgi:hypothetical protein